MTIIGNWQSENRVMARSQIAESAIAPSHRTIGHRRFLDRAITRVPDCRLPIVVALLVISVLAGSAGAQHIEWQTRLDSARAAALRDNRPILIEFWAAWCAPCKFMDANVYTDPRVAAAMGKVLPVRVDVDRETVLTRKYSVEGMPTIVFADSRGNELFRYSGLLTVDLMLGLLRELPGDIARVNQLAGALEQDEDDLAALEGLGRELRAAALYRASNKYYRRALRAPAARQRADTRAAILREIGRNHEALQEPDEAAKAFREADRLEGSSKSSIRSRAAPPSAGRHTGDRPADTSTPTRARR